MTRSETIAYNAGVLAVLGLAMRVADAIEPKLVDRPTRLNFAIGALVGLAAEGQALLLPMPGGFDDPAVVEMPRPPAPTNLSTGAMAEVRP